MVSNRNPYISSLMKLGTWMMESRGHCCHFECYKRSEFWCSNHGSRSINKVCRVHSCAACSPLHKNYSIWSAPKELLDSAWLEVEKRMIKLGGGINHKERSTYKWLGNWMKIIQEEIQRQKDEEGIEECRMIRNFP